MVWHSGMVFHYGKFQLGILRRYVKYIHHKNYDITNSCLLESNQLEQYSKLLTTSKNIE
ncbi:hypothetical protein RhiirA4_460704 [Rhizophagus irregularis]|uniref:Uncharacterized protein n=1 Tax=Rhizophagus irregularis TaxID=588596 RepID=A0A2I1GH87_9GLOM|nr:hypothetical protein RhiirA4_460704 [Rhizophagus irregularis]